MKRQFRILKHKEFDRIIHTGQKTKTSHFTIFLEPNQEKSRIGIAVSKSNGGAVSRVRIKRQIRAMIAESYNLNAPNNLIIVVRPSYDTSAYQSEKEELLKGLLEAQENHH